MSIAVPTRCANPECRDHSFKPIHHISQGVAIDAVDGARVFAHLITYRCTRCGHTWGVRGHSPDASPGPLMPEGVGTHEGPQMREKEPRGRGW
jgi:hypothetical protein